MKTALAVLWLWLVGGIAAADTALVEAGEHSDFTRIVVQLPAPSVWRVGRTPDGYELAVDDPVTDFDLSAVFARIPRSRLSSIAVDPDSGRLKLGVGCACHAVPFAFRPDVVVIDLRDGQPPEGSSYELPLAVQARPMPERLAQYRPRPRPQAARQVAPQVPWPAALPGILPFDVPVPEPSLDLETGAGSADLAPMRTALLAQFAEAASRGVIDAENPDFPSADSGDVSGVRADPQGVGPLAHLAVPAQPDAGEDDDRTGTMTQDGGACLPDEDVDIASWGDDRPFDDQLAEARTGLVGEFDRPDPDAVASLVRLYLFFGFGAEAQATMQNLPVEQKFPGLWAEMAVLIDRTDADADGILAGQTDCKGTVALWAALASPVLVMSGAPDQASVLRAFSGLPAHLRRHLGPELAERYLAIGDIPTAQSLRDAIWRAPGDPGDGARLVDGMLRAELGNPAEAAAALDAVSAGDGRAGALALVELVDLQIAQGLPVRPGAADDLADFAAEFRGKPEEPALIRAQSLALASEGDFDRAFTLGGGGPKGTLPDLWQLLAETGSDSDLLGRAVLDRAAELPEVSTKTARRIADRLTALGFAEPALRWLPDDGSADAAIARARAEQRAGDARSALRRLAGQTGAAAAEIRAAALIQMGEPAAAVQAFAEAGDSRAEAAALWQARDWAAAAQALARPGMTEAVTALLQAPPVFAEGSDAPLARGRALIADAVATREAVALLLQADAPALPPIP